MTKGTKIWLCFALALGAVTLLLNLAYGRLLSVVIAAGALAGLSILLIRQQKTGYSLMCLCYVLSFISGVYQGTVEGTGFLISVVMSLIGSSLIPIITWLFLRGQWSRLR